MSSLWIVHRDAALRAALARLAGAPEDSVRAAPEDPAFDTAATPEVVLLGLAGDLESELEFAHRLGPRLRGSRVVLVGPGDLLEKARRLFDSLPAVLLTYPPEAAVLRAALRDDAERPEAEPLPLSQRPARDALADRFARGFADLELPGLLRALDPRLPGVPVLILGEPGTGRGTLARYVHHFGATAGGALVELPCSAQTSSRELLEAMAAARHNPRSLRACGLWLEDADRLAPAVARQVQGWIEYGLPPGALRTATVRWIATSGEGLDPGLRRALSGLCLRVPPLRERPQLVANLANRTVDAWCAARSMRPRRLGEHALAVLEEYPWPGNLRELEAVIEQSLAASAADPLGPEDLVLDGEPFAPLEAGAPPTSEALATAVVEELGDEGEALLEELRAEMEEELPVTEPPAEPWPAEPPLDLPAAQTEAPTATAERDRSPEDLLRLAGAVGQEVRSPLAAVRTYAELLPERYADPEFRDDFAKLAQGELARVEEVLGRLDRLASFPTPQRQPVDVGRMLEEVLDKRRSRIHDRRLLVLEELDRQQTLAIADPDQLRFAFESLLDKSLELVPQRGHVYLASKRHDAGPGGAASVRVLVRYRGPELPSSSGEQPEVVQSANTVDFAIAELLIRAQGGTLTLDTSERTETVIVIDLPG